MYYVGDGPGRQPTRAPRTNPPLHSHRIPSFRFRLPPHSGLAQVFSTLSGCLNGLPLEDRLIPDARNCHFRLKFLAPLVAHWRSVSCSHTYPAPQLTHYALSRSQILRTRVRSHPLGPGGGPVHAGHGLVQAADVLQCFWQTIELFMPLAPSLRSTGINILNKTCATLARPGSFEPLCVAKGT